MNKAKKLISLMEQDKGMFIELEWKPKMNKYGLRYATQSQMNLMYQLTKEARIPLPKGGGWLHVSKGEEYDKFMDIAKKHNVKVNVSLGTASGDTK